MNPQAYSIRSAALSDVDEMVRVEKAGWPAPLAADAELIESRVRTFPEGQLVAVREGQVAAVIATQRVTAEYFQASPATYERLTDRGRLAGSHDPRGDVFHLIGVAVDPAGRGAGLGRAVVNAALDLARGLHGVERILGYTRPAAFHRYPGLSIESYLALRDARGRPVDPVVAMHAGNGARIIAAQPGFRAADVESRGYGVLIEYPRLKPPGG